MFRPNNRCWRYERSQVSDSRGEFSYASKVSIPCAVVEIATKVDRTTVRADSSASRGAASEDVGTSKLLFPTFARVEFGDIIEFEGVFGEVMAIFPRRNVMGRLDHYEVDLRPSRKP